MSVTDPDTPDPLNDPRTTQADPGAYAQGADLASAGDDDPAAPGDDEPAAGATEADDAGGGSILVGGLPVEGGITSLGGEEPDDDTGNPLAQVPPVG
jgi:hypothetical protein